jgi:hypothetical protein
MPKLVFANTTSRAMVARPDDIPEDMRAYYDVLATRLLWSLDDGDIAVVPGKVSGTWLTYAADLLGLTSAPAVLSLREHSDTGWYATPDSRLAEKLRHLIDASGVPACQWQMKCYIHDRDFAGWQRLLGIGVAESERFAQGTAELVNSKMVFRSMATACGVPIAEGRVVDRGPELVDAVTELLSRTGGVIIKQDVNSGGEGNVLITSDNNIKQIGAYGVVRLTAADRDTVASALRPLGLADVPDLPAGASPAHSIVEVYHPSCRDLSSDVFVPLTGAPLLMNYSDLRMAPLWKGSVYPPQELEPSLHAYMGAYTQQIGIMAQQLGYRGIMNIDAIVNTSGELLFTEFNGRVGGGTSIDTVARRVLGQDYLTKYVLASQNEVEAPLLPVLLSNLRERGLLYKRGSRNGVIIYTDNTADLGTIEYIVVGRDWEETTYYERQLRKLLEEF